jgi:hypothetical protein
MKANGAVLWRGASLIDGAPLVVIAVGLANASSNRKTGAMVQTYILRADIDPVAAVRTRADVSICGQCPHRGDPGQARGRTCYVNIGQGPLGVWRAWKRGAYSAAIVSNATNEIDTFAFAELGHLGAGRLVRLGTYGDPAAVPTRVWSALTSAAVGHTGYTHQWRACDPMLKRLCMASADSVADAQEAQAAGWRTFRVAMPCDAPRESNEAVCPASAEAGKKLTCAQCLACAGANGRRGSIVIQAHGGFAVMAHVNRGGIRPYFARSN